MNLVLLGAPGAGKGFHAKKISEKFKIPTISTGDLIRSRIQVGDDKAKLLESFVSSGKLVDDNLIGEILKNRVDKDDCRNGFVLDGFPRSLSQAKLLDKLKINVDKVIEIDIDEQEIYERLINRRVCERCGATFNLLLKKPKIANECDFCGGKLIRRDDDNELTIKNRLSVFAVQTKPLRDFYQNLNKYYMVDSKSGSDEVQRKICEIIG